MYNYVAILYLLYSVLLTFSLKIIIEVFLGKRNTTFIKDALPYVFFCMAISLNTIIMNIPIVNITIGFGTAFIITLSYESTTLKRIAAVVVFFVLGISLDSIQLIALTRYPISMTNPVADVYDNHFWITPSLLFVTALVFSKFKNIKNSKMASPMLWVAVLFIPTASIFMIVIVIGYITHLMAFIFVVGIFGINFLAFYLYDSLSAAYERKLESALHIQEKEYYYSQYQLMQESIVQIKSIRHDMKNHLGTIKGYSDKIGADEITNHINGLLNDIEKSEIYSDTGNIVFDSIINFKLKDACEENIKTELRLSIPPALNIEISDIITIMGNLLDNALNAVSKVSDKRIKLDIEYSRDSLYIQIDNTFDGEVKYEQKKDSSEKNLVTLKNPEEHGHGLKNIRKSVEKYNGKVDITHEDNVFSVTVLIYVDDGV